MCAVLNSTPVNEAIKPHQTGGHFGERDIHRRPFEILPIPEFDPENPVHQELAELSEACHYKAAEMRVDPKRRIDLARRDVRETLAAELEKVDRLVEKLLENSSHKLHKSNSFGVDLFSKVQSSEDWH